MPRPSWGKNAGGAPDGGAVLGDPGQTAQVHRVQEDSADVDQLQTGAVGGLAYNLAFAHAGRAPEKHRLADVDKEFQGLGYCCCFHGLSVVVAFISGEFDVKKTVNMGYAPQRARTAAASCR